MRFQCVTILAVVAAVASAAPLAEYLGEVAEKTGWKCVGSEEGKVVVRSEGLETAVAEISCDK